MRYQMKPPVVISFALSLPILFCSHVQAQFQVQAVRANGAVQIDGVPHPEEWKGAPLLDQFVQFEPHRGEAAREKTEAYVLYDDLYVYFGFRCYDSEPSRITGQLNRRDSDLLSDDAVLVILDTFHDLRSSYFFITNPLATQMDGRVSENGKVVETTWDASWRSAAARFDGGWTAEIAVPLSTLRFRPGRDRNWGLNVGRTCRRLLETSLWAGPLEQLYRISQYGTLAGLNLEAAQRKYEVLAYTLGHFQENRENSFATGLDLRYALTPENVARVTLNPDFATIEADQEIINLTRFEVGLQEKRQFFLEGSEQYQQRIQTFYSRRISDIRFGTKLLGRRGGWQYSLLTAQSDPLTPPGADGLREPANYSVFRLQRNVLKSSIVALMAGNRSLGGTNQGAVGLDTTLYFTPHFGFTGQLITSYGPQEGGHWAWFVRPAYDTSTGHIHFRYTHLGDRFGDHVNAVGFIRDDDRREMDSAVEKRFWFRRGPLERIAYDSNYNIYWSQSKVLRSWQVDERIVFDFRNRWQASVSHTSEYKLFEKKFRNHQNQIAAGYNTREWQSVFLAYRFGRNFDSDFQLLGATWRRKLSEELSFEYELSRLWLDPDPHNSSTVIHVLRAVHNFTKDLFLKVFYQTNSVIDRQNFQGVFVWRYKPPFGSIQLAFQRGTAAFGQRSEQGNTLLLKFAYVF